MKFSSFTPEQQYFLAMMFALADPIPLEVAGILSPISSAELSSLIYQAGQVGWLRHKDPTHIELTTKIPKNIISEIRKLNTPERLNQMIQILKKDDLHNKIKPGVLLSLLEKYGKKRDAGHAAFQMALKELNKPNYMTAYAYQKEAVFNFYEVLGDSDSNRIFFSGQC